jgi:epoxyqueuosine reductase QueG
LEEKIRQIAREAGADLVGITSKKRLEGNKCSDPTYYLPEAQSVIGFAVSLDPKIVRAFLGKKSITAQEKMSRLEGETYHK